MNAMLFQPACRSVCVALPFLILAISSVIEPCNDAAEESKQQKPEQTVYVESGQLKYEVVNGHYTLDSLTDEQVVLVELSPEDNINKWVIENIKRYPNLRTVILSGDHFFNENWPESLKQFPKLQQVVMDSVNLTTQEYNDICNKHQELTFFRSQRSAIANLKLGGGLMKLETHDFATPNSGLDDSHFKRIVSIERHVLMQGTFPSASLRFKSRIELCNVWSIKHLNLNDTLIDNHEFKCYILASKSELETIKASYTKISKLDWEGLHWKKVRHIDFSNSHFDGALSAFPNLERAILHNTEFSNESCRSLVNLEKLKVLNVANTKLDSEGLDIICKLKTLKHIELDSTFKESTKIKTLLINNPDVKIIFPDGTSL